jgi:AraC family transcriptional regulator, positive regulator of tynA and feaB
MYRSFPVTAVPERERFGYFCAVVDDVFCPMQLQARGRSCDYFRGCVEATDIGSVRLAKVSASPCEVTRFAGDVARLSEAPYLVKFQMKGESHWSQRNKTVHLTPGDFVIASMAEPYSLQLFDDFEMPVLALTSRTMHTLTRDPDQFLGVRMAAEEADCGLLSSFVSQVVARISRLQEPMISRVEANILDLLGGVLSARNAHGAVSTAQLLGQVKAYIGNHLHDQRLGPAMIAAAFTVSKRHIHSLFAADGMSLGRYVRSRRLDASRRMITDNPGMSLTDVALGCGFYDLSHMSRCFRQQYDVTPRDFRALLGAPTAADPKRS